MPSSKNFLDFVLEELSHIGYIDYRAMMGEYILYYKGKVVGGIYDDRILVKITPSSKRLLTDATLEMPYDGAKEMLAVCDIENKELMKELFESMYDELPSPKKK